MKRALSSFFVCLFVFCLLSWHWAAAEDQHLIVPLSQLKKLQPENDSVPGLGDTVQRSRLPGALQVALDAPSSEAYICTGMSEMVRRWRVRDNASPAMVDVSAQNVQVRNATESLENKFNNDELYLVARLSHADQKPSYQISFRASSNNIGATGWDQNEKVTAFEYQLDWQKHYRNNNEKVAKTAFLLASTTHLGSFDPWRWEERVGKPIFQQLAKENLQALNQLYGLEKRDANDDQNAQQRRSNFSSRQFDQSLVRSFDMLSGSRAIEQNLELAAVINAWKAEARTVDVAEITGITVAEIDWAPLLKELPPTTLDPLAGYIPEDQHVVLFPTFSAAYKMGKLTEASGVPVLQTLNYRKNSSDKRTFERYQKQLGISFDAMTEQLGPTVIRSVAMTGGDLYFPTGTDLTVLFETPNAVALTALLSSKMMLNFAGDKTVVVTSEKIGDHAYTSYVNPARTVSAYLMSIDSQTVAVSNSLVSLKRIVETAAKKNQSLADLPEYRFFRDRYKYGDANETVYAFLSDATIRRWCGPKWRIAASRRLWQQAMIGEQQAEHRNEIIAGSVVESQKLDPTKGMPVLRPQAAIGTRTADVPQAADTARAADVAQVVDAAQVADAAHDTSGDAFVADPELIAEAEYWLTTAGVRSDTYGAYDFLTPIIELDVKKVSSTERQAYDTWRAEYEGRWRGSFDPIGVRLTLTDDKIASDVTVMPINVRTLREFGSILNVTEGAQFAANQSTHGMPFQLMVSINTKSQQFQAGSNFAQQMVQGTTVGWIGDYFSVYFDEDPFWDVLALKITNDLDGRREPLRFLFEEGNIGRIPIAVEIDSKNSLQLAAFLTGLRTMVTQSAPNAVFWESLQYHDVSYVKLTPQEMREMKNLAIYYTTVGGKLFVTLSETMMQKAIDRFLATKTKTNDTVTPEAEAVAAQDNATDTVPAVTPFEWVGQNIAFRVDQRAIPFIDQCYLHETLKPMLQSAEKNIPVLNVYRRIFPGKDPVKMHEQLWGERLFCPNGGQYVWDEKYQTYKAEFGDLPEHSPIAAIESANVGVTFEHQGIRARVELNLKKPESKK